MTHRDLYTIKLLWPSILSSTEKICIQSNLVSILWPTVTYTIKILWPSALSSTQKICSESNLVSILWRVVTDAIKGGPRGIYQWQDWCWILALSELWKNRSGPSCSWWKWCKSGGRKSWHHPAAQHLFCSAAEPACLWINLHAYLLGGGHFFGGNVLICVYQNKRLVRSIAKTGNVCIAFCWSPCLLVWFFFVCISVSVFLHVTVIMTFIMTAYAC